MKNMKNVLKVLIVSLFFISCKAQEPTEFSEKALQDTFITLKGESVTFQSILDAHKGKTVLIDIWASWCGDCIKGMPKVKALQANYPDVSYVFLSLDKGVDNWKKGIKKFEVEGSHYFMQSGWKGDFGTFVNLDWIPRYMVVDKQGTIKVFKAVKANDKQIKQALQ